jgi:putative DNA-invertase from lambdoid prophage Rac
MLPRYQWPKADKLTPKIPELLKEGFSYRRIANDLRMSKNTVMGIIQREKTAPN